MNKFTCVFQIKFEDVTDETGTYVSASLRLADITSEDDEDDNFQLPLMIQGVPMRSKRAALERVLEVLAKRLPSDLFP